MNETGKEPVETVILLEWDGGKKMGISEEPEFIMYKCCTLSKELTTKSI